MTWTCRVQCNPTIPLPPGSRDRSCFLELHVPDVSEVWAVSVKDLRSKSRKWKGARPCSKWVTVLDSWSEQGTFIHVAFSIYTGMDAKPIDLVRSLVRFVTSIWWPIGPIKRRKKYLPSVTSLRSFPWYVWGSCGDTDIDGPPVTISSLPLTRHRKAKNGRILS
jgi:hypothetical protein